MTQQWLGENRGLGEWDGREGRERASTPQQCRGGALVKGTQKRNGLMLCRYNRHTKVLPTPSPLPPSGPEFLALAMRYLVVGADVQQDGEALLWIDPSARSVQGQFAHRDAHAVAAQVSQAQDTLSISHHHCLEKKGGHQSGTAPSVTKCSF